MTERTVISTVLALFCVCASAQTRTFERIVQRNPWNAGSNVNGIRQDSISISSAEIFAIYQGGGLHRSNEASEEVTAGAVARTLLHLKRFSMKGEFSFSHFEGWDMCGSMFMENGAYPFDIIEFTPGRKTLQKYSFDGGISYDLNPEWRIGGDIDFVSRNYSKRKDLRYTNYRLDLEVNPGILWHRGRWAAGLNYIYQRDYETVRGEVIGTANSSYFAFLDKGMMYGTYGTWESNGIHLAESGINAFPVKRNTHGAAVQVQYADAFAQISYRWGKGIAGEKQSLWFEFPGQKINACAVWSTGDDVRRHFIRLKYEWETVSNDESVLEKVTDGGITTTRKYSSNRIFTSEGFTLNPEYEYVSDKWELGVQGNIYNGWEISSQIFPYLYARNLTLWSVCLSGLVRFGNLALGAGAGWEDGSWEEQQSQAEDSAGGTVEPFRLLEYSDIQREYETTGKIGVELMLRYDVFKGLFVEAGGSWKHGFGFDRYGNSQRWSGQLKLGYIF